MTMTSRAQLSIGNALVSFTEEELLPELDISAEQFWNALSTLVGAHLLPLKLSLIS